MVIAFSSSEFFVKNMMTCNAPCILRLHFPNFIVHVFLHRLVVANSYTVRDVEGFLSEAVKLQGMEHANLLTVLGVVIEDNKPYMVLPLMDHGDMKSFLAQPEQVCCAVRVFLAAVTPVHGLRLPLTIKYFSM